MNLLICSICCDDGQPCKSRMQPHKTQAQWLETFDFWNAGSLGFQLHTRYHHSGDHRVCQIDCEHTAYTAQYAGLQRAEAASTCSEGCSAIQQLSFLPFWIHKLEFDVGQLLGTVIQALGKCANGDSYPARHEPHVPFVLPQRSRSIGSEVPDHSQRDYRAAVRSGMAHFSSNTAFSTSSKSSVSGDPSYILYLPTRRLRCTTDQAFAADHAFLPTAQCQLHTRADNQRPRNSPVGFGLGARGWLLVSSRLGWRVVGSGLGWWIERLLSRRHHPKCAAARYTDVVLGRVTFWLVWGLRGNGDHNLQTKLWSELYIDTHGMGCCTHLPQDVAKAYLKSVRANFESVTHSGRSTGARAIRATVGDHNCRQNMNSGKTEPR